MPWLSVREAAETLQLSTRTIQRMVAANIFPSRLDKGLRLVCLGDDPGHPAIEKQDPALLSHLFDIVEGLAALRVLCYQRLTDERQVGYVFDDLDLTGTRPGLAAWEKFYLRIKQCQQSVEPVLAELRLDPSVLNRVYRSMITARIQWNKYDQPGREWQSRTRQTAGARIGVLITETISSLRQLLIGSL
jgi:hypothetical protein